jgi:uncharacterized membrane protein
LSISTASAIPASRERIQSIDVLRGIVIVLMVLDHARDFVHESGYAYNPLDPAHTTVLLYITRWITHLCAPTFVFLAGVSIWLQRARGKDLSALSGHLIRRGGWLILLELTLVSLGWEFEIPYTPLLQVIWVIGWSMVVMAALIWLPRWSVAIFGAGIVLGHNALDFIQPQQLGACAWLWVVLKTGGLLHVGGSSVVLDPYPVLPWTGVMALGYVMGGVFLESPSRRDWLLTAMGLALVLVFLLLRLENIYGDPHEWVAHAGLVPTVMSFFDLQKYPPSLLYVCATLGPVIASVPLIECWHGKGAQFFRTFGAVPMFAYVIHLYLVHSLSIVLHVAFHKDVQAQFGFIQNMFLAPELAQGSGLPLPLVYILWAGTIALLYPLCRWFSEVKSQHTQWWLSYL